MNTIQLTSDKSELLVYLRSMVYPAGNNETVRGIEFVVDDPHLLSVMSVSAIAQCIALAKSSRQITETIKNMSLTNFTLNLMRTHVVGPSYLGCGHCPTSTNEELPAER